MQTRAAHAMVAGDRRSARTGGRSPAKAASRLQTVHDGWESKRSELDGALRYNRKLWAIFLTR